MNSVIRSCLLSLGLCATMFVSAPSMAQTPAAGKDPVALYAKGKIAIEKGDFQGALASLEPSYAALASPNTLLLVAHAKRGLGRKIDAVKDYEHVEADADVKIKAGETRYNATQQEARKWIETLSGELARVSAKIEHGSDSAVVRLNGEVVKAQVEAAGTLVVSATWVIPGHVELRVDAAGKTKTASADVTAGGKSSLVLDLADKPKAPPPPPPPVPVKVSKGIPLGAWIAGGVGVAGLATFGVFAAMAKSDYDQLQTCSPRCPDSDRSTADSGKTKQTVANIGLVVGGVGVATAVGIILFAPKKSSSDPSVGLRMGPGAFVMHGRF